ncbi:MAG: hypothetical protein ACXWNK_11150 [Vulcanimicrobiaceae bacterium]
MIVPSVYTDRICTSGMEDSPISKRVALVALIGVAGLAAPVAAAEQTLSLRQLAAQSGFSFRWLGAAGEATIVKPGLTIVIRPGNRFFEVNTRVEGLASVPQAKGDDIFVSPVFARRIEALGEAPPAKRSANVVVTTTPIAGALSLHVAPATGLDALHVSCNGPINAPVTVTLFATLSSDIPTILVSRHDFTIDRSGQLSTTIPIASDFVRGSILTVRVTSLDTVSPAQASLLVGSPNPHVSVPLEQLPPIFH